MRDWQSVICVIVSLALWSSSVWIFYLLYWITGNDIFLGIGTAVLAWWSIPVLTPFAFLVSITACGFKELVIKIGGKNGND